MSDRLSIFEFNKSLIFFSHTFATPTILPLADISRSFISYIYNLSLRTVGFRRVKDISITNSNYFKKAPPKIAWERQIIERKM